MITWLCESPVPILVIGVLATLITLAVMWQTGRGEWLYAALVTAVITAALFGIERYVITDHEQLVALIERAAGYARANDFAGSAILFSPATRTQHGKYLQRIRGYNVQEATILRQTIELVGNPSQQATANILARINVSGRESYVGGLGVTVSFVKQDDQWYLNDIEW